MKSLRVILALALADFRERTRRYAFLMTMLAAIYLAYGVYAGDIVLDLDRYRGVPNSAWTGMSLAVTASVFLSIAGFYIIKNSVLRDRTTRVGEILATTPVGKLEYLLGKTLSNFAVLMSIVALEAVGAAVMFLLRESAGGLEPWTLLSPFLLVAAPAMAFIAAVAVLFETVPILRGGAGNVIYFFLWSGLFAVPLANDIESADMTFLLSVQKSMSKPLVLVNPEYKGGFSVTVGDAAVQQRGSFVWEGMEWTPERLAMRAGWFLYAFLLVAGASLLFDRFDSANPAQSGVARRRSRAKRWEIPIGRLTFRSRFLQLTLAEFRLAVQGLPWWWYVGAAGLIVATILTPLDVMRSYIVPALFLWPVLLWSGMGVRESTHRTGQVVFASPMILKRQFPAMLLSGVVVAAALSAGAAFRLGLEEEWGALLGLAIACMVVPSAALAFGTWTGNSRTFEAVYTIAWYIGPMQHVPAIDYLGVSPTAIAAGTAPVMAAAAIVFAALAYAGRRRQILAL